jgi:membrane protein
MKGSIKMAFRWEAAKVRLLKIWRIAYLAALNFWEDDCYTKSSTLTFYTFQSLVPLLAATLAIAKGFGFEEYLENLLTSTFGEQKEILNYAIQIALSLLNSISSGKIVGAGVLLLLWTNINLVGYIEYTLNEIWRVKISRSFFQKIKDFIFAVVVFPLILVASSSATLYVEGQIENFAYLDTFRQIFVHDMRLILPWVLSCTLFGMLYFLIPNTKMRVMPRLIASIIAGIAFQFWQFIFINLQLYIFSYNAIYGAFALLPLFLIWLQFSWIIVLACAEISANIENSKFYLKDLSGKKLITVSECELALLILYEHLSTFYEDKAPLSLTKLSDQLKIPQNIIQDILSFYEENNILVSFSSKNGEICYLLLNDPSRFKILNVYDLFLHRNDSKLLIESSDIINHIRETLENIKLSTTSLQANVSLYDFFQLQKKVSRP